MRLNSLIFSLCLLLVGITSCTSYKKVPYLQTGEKGGEIDLVTLYKENTVRFQPDDVLSIVVNVVGEQSVAYDYNLPLQPAATTDNSSESFVNQGVGRQTYMVNKAGEIDFPVLGAIKVSGYTQAELERYLKESLNYSLKNPVVTVRLVNFKISIVGEVNRPGQYNVSRDHVNILEALALAGDMTVYGKRDDVRVIREMPDGELKMVVLDISKIEAASSPYFYLHQNDQIYVVPNSVKARSADIGSQTSIIFSVVGVLFSIANIVIYSLK
jgi:polysaccharide export outer membrane protein